MRHSSMFRLMLGLVAGVLVCSVPCWFSSCVDDTFGTYGQGASGPLSFAVSVPDGWINGSTRVADKDISIKKMSQSTGLQQLYLITEVSEAVVEAAAFDAVTRGMPVTSGDKFINQSFGLSAICYVGEWPDTSEEEKKLTTNFAHNLRVKKSSTSTDWIPESKLDWLGSGNIKFFAYSPYSEDFKAGGESGSSDETENSTSVAGGILIHSESTVFGIPALTYTVSTVATKQPDLMVAVSDVHDRGQTGAVSLQFRHALTAVTVKTGKDMLKGSIKKVTFSGLYGKGIYKFAAKTDDANDVGSWTIPTGEKTIDFIIERNVTMSNTEDTGSMADAQGKENNYVDSDNPVSIVDGEFTLMMIPQTLPKEAKLTIVFVNDMTGTEHTLTANLSPEGKTEWGIGKKVTYSVSTTGIVITPVVKIKIDGKEVAPYSVDGKVVNETGEWKDSLCISGYLPNVELAAYAEVVQADQKEDKVRLPYIIEYSTDEGKTWASTTVPMAHSSSSVNIWNPIAETTRASDEEVARLISGVMFLPQQPAYASMQKEFFPLKFTPASEVAASTKDVPYDLTQGGETANCYIVNQPGYYSFPAVYGNARRSGTIGNGKGGVLNPAAYTYTSAGVEGETTDRILEKFVKHDDSPITDMQVEGATRAALVWQDAPNLVTDVNYDAETNMIKFHVAKETLTQGNAVIAVLDGEGEKAMVLWSWHIWTTHYDWSGKDDYKVVSANLSSESDSSGKEYHFAPCNLGYCDPHEGNPQRTVQVRFKFTLENVVGERYKEIIFSFPQSGIEKSLGGDNTYFQWGRKDPMLAGIYNKETIAYEKVLADNGVGVGSTGNAELKRPSGQLTMANKKYYPGIRAFVRGESSVSIGTAIKNPNVFYMYDRVENTKRTHWHDGKASSYDKERVINLWNSQLYKSDVFDFDGEKSVYDPSPAGYHVPPVNAFTGFGDGDVDLVNSGKISDSPTVIEIVKDGGHVKGWWLKRNVDPNGKAIFFPGSGIRDMGENQEFDFFKGKTWAAFSQITFVATSSVKGGGFQSTVFSLDSRNTGVADVLPNDTYGINVVSNNAYGFTVRPVRDKD